MKMMSHLGVLLLGIVLGIAVALPVSVLASNWSFFGGNQGKAGVEGSSTTQQQAPLVVANVDSPESTSRQANQGQQEDKHEKMMDQCAAMMQNMQDMMDSGGMMGPEGMMSNGGMMGNGGMRGGSMGMGR